MTVSNPKTFVCIVCPQECEIKLDMDNAPHYSIKGNRCRRGEQFVLQEITLPSRILTTTIPVEGGICKRLPVRSSAPVPKQLAAQWLKAVKELSIQAPVALGDVLLNNAQGTNTDVLAAKSVPLQEYNE